MRGAPRLLPPRVLALVVLTGGLGVLLSGAAWIEVLGGGRQGRVLDLLAVAAIVLVGDVALLRLRWGGNSNSFTWMEASLVVGAAIGGWANVVALLGPVVLVRQLLVRRPWHKAVFNAGSVVVSGTLARAAYLAVAADWKKVPDELGARSAGALVLAAVVYFLSVSVLVSWAVASAQELHLLTVWRRGLRLRLTMLLGNILVGIGIVSLPKVDHATLVAVPFVALALYVAYNNALRTQQERDIWRELHGAPEGVSLNRVDLPGVIEAVRHRASLLFGAEVTLLLLHEADGVPSPAPGLLALGSNDGPQRLQARGAEPQIGHELRLCGVSSAALASLETGGENLGVLLIGYRNPLRIKRRELQLLKTFAEQTAVSVQHARLFEAVDEQRSRLSSIVDNASDGIALVDAAGRVRAWNDAMHRMTERAEREALGAPLEAVLPGTLEDGGALTGIALLRHLDHDDHAEVLAVIDRADGLQRDISMSVSAVRSTDTGYAVIVARDVTSQREAQQAKEDFIATVSHELRTPLTPIKGYLKLLQRPGMWADEERRNSVLTILGEQATQLERLVEDLLSVSRMTHGQFVVEPQEVDVDAVVTRAVRDLAAGGERTVHQRHDRTGALATCDPARLQQVVANLLSNADKYSPTGAQVVVEVHAGAEVEVVVTDGGAGVPIESRAKVFEPFHRLGDHLTRSTRGTGLGLHIARQLVEAMGGRIWVDGPPGAGASFHVTVPAAASRQLPVEPPADEENEDLAGRGELRHTPSVA